MLRELGVKSHVALVCAANGIDVPRDVGAFGLFNHAITYIPETDQWVDLTAEDYPVGLLPLRTQGRRALICDAENSRIAVTPMLSHAQNQSNEIRTLDLNFSGGGHVTVGLGCKGIYALEMRGGYETALPMSCWKPGDTSSRRTMASLTSVRCSALPTRLVAMPFAPPVQPLSCSVAKA